MNVVHCSTVVLAKQRSSLRLLCMLSTRSMLQSPDSTGRLYWQRGSVMFVKASVDTWSLVALSKWPHVKLVLSSLGEMNVILNWWGLKRWAESWFYFASNTASYIGRICFLPRPSQHPCIRNNKTKIETFDKQTYEADRLELVLNHLQFWVQTI